MVGMTPIVGITADGTAPDQAPTEAEYVVRMNYASAVRAAGGLPVILPWLQEDAPALIERFDGFLFTGGTPGVFTTPGRTAFERTLLRAALARKRPVLGICNGMQLMGQELGADFIESIGGEIAGALDHLPEPIPTQPAHAITLTPGTRLHRLAGSASVQVNSLHRQAISGGGDFTVAATAPDGVIEAIEGPGWTVGLQWHPEYGLTALDRAIFADFVSACRAN